MKSNRVWSGMFGRWLDGRRPFFIPVIEVRKYELAEADPRWANLSHGLSDEARSDLEYANVKYVGRWVRDPGPKGAEGILLIRLKGARRFFVPKTALPQYEVPDSDVEGQSRDPLPPVDIETQAADGPPIVVIVSCVTSDC